MTASAPGKIVLGGEYAVLRGYPAIAAAVGRRAQARVQPIAAGHFVLTTRGYHDGSCRLRQVAPGCFDYLDSPPAAGTFALVERIVAAACPDRQGGSGIEIDSAAFVAGNGQKLGIGSSAAVTVALSAALAGDTDPARAFSRALALHRASQGGGSGVDVACSAFGGVIEYRDEQARSIAFPMGLCCAVAWSGRPSDTAERIARLDRKLAGGDGELRALGRAAEKLADAFREGQAGAALEGLGEFAAALESFDAALELGIFSATDTMLAADARESGVVFKPCGAGGGDVAAFFALEQDRLERFVTRAADSGYVQLPVALGVPGLSGTDA